MSVTIREVVDDVSVEELLDLRNRCKVISTIQNFFKSKGKKKPTIKGTILEDWYTTLLML